MQVLWQTKCNKNTYFIILKYVAISYIQQPMYQKTNRAKLYGPETLI